MKSRTIELDRSKKLLTRQMDLNKNKLVINQTIQIDFL